MIRRLSLRSGLVRQLRPMFAALVAFAVSSPVMAGSVAWLDDLVKDVIKETEASAKVVARSTEGSSRGAGRLFVKESGESLETVTRRYDDFARIGRGAAAPSEVLLESRFQKLLKPNPDAARAFSALAPAEKRVVVELAEVAQGLAKKFPGQAEDMVRKLGTEGMAAVRTYGDDVAEVVAREGSESLGILKKTGRPGWKFYTEQVLKHKKKLAAAGVLTVFMADPDRFIDGAGRVTAYAVDQFARAGVQLASAVGGGVMTGLGNSFSTWLTSLGIDLEIARYLGMGLAGITVILATMVLLGFPIRWIFKPFGVVFRLFRGGKRVTTSA
jgi:hypothetical protein